MSRSYNPVILESPCFNCEERELGCHATCPKYAKYRHVCEVIKHRKAAVNEEREFYLDVHRKHYPKTKRG